MAGPQKWFASAVFGILAVQPVCAHAQEVGSTGSRVRSDDPEYRLDPIDVGPFTLTAGGEARIEYASNLFAEPVDAQADAIVTFRPFAQVEHRAGNLATTFTARGDLRQHADFTSENSEGVGLRLASSWSPQAGEALTFAGGWDRVAEEREDPEARRLLGVGPRLFENLGGSIGYRRAGSRFLLEASGEARKINALDPIDDLRDHNTYSGRITLGVRPGGAFYFTGTGYYTQLAFRLDAPVSNADRDVATVGGQLGIQFADGGLVQGGISAGVFKLDVADPTLDDRTGFSMQGQLTYRPRPRTSFRLDLFNGDVASFRGGGSARIDTRIGLSVQQEIRHNLLANVGAGWEQTNFFAADTGQQTWRASSALEYLVSRNFSLIGTFSFHSRTSDLPDEEFDGLRGGAGVRMRF